MNENSVWLLLDGFQSELKNTGFLVQLFLSCLFLRVVAQEMRAGTMDLSRQESLGKTTVRGSTIRMLTLALLKLSM